MNKKLRFVVHEHRTAEYPVHWDMMLEQKPCREQDKSTELATLETFRLPCPAYELEKKSIIITKILDHPARFLTYEGSVNKGKGNVTLIASGEYEELSDGSGQRMLTFEGDNLSGRYRLEHSEGDNWILTSVD